MAFESGEWVKSHVPPLGKPGEDSPFRFIKDPKTGKSRGQAPWRIGMLKGYGNAIVPEVAAEFIQATVKGDHHQ